MTRELTDKDLLNLTPEQAAEIYAQGPEAVARALLKLRVLAKAKAAAEAADEASKPSSQIAPYQKPVAKKGAKGLAVMSSLLLSVRFQKGDPLAFTRDLVAENLHKARCAIFPGTS